MVFAKRKRRLLSWYNRWYLKLYRNYLGGLVLGAIVFILCGIIIIFGIYRHQDRFLIKKVLYPIASMSVYNDIDLYTTMTDLYTNTYYLDTKRFNQDKFLNIVQLKYPFVDKIIIRRFNANRLVIEPLFKEPLVVAYHRSQRFALYQDLILPLDSGNILGKQSLSIYLPQYLSGSLFLSGILYAQQDIQKLAGDVQALYQLPLSGVVTYMPGGEKYVYGELNRYVYFNAKKPLSGQIQQFYELLHNYSKFSSLQKIDIGSTDFPIVK